MKVDATRGPAYLVIRDDHGITISRRQNSIHLPDRADVIALFDAISRVLDGAA